MNYKLPGAHTRTLRRGRSPSLVSSSSTYFQLAHVRIVESSNKVYRTSSGFALAMSLVIDDYELSNKVVIDDYELSNKVVIDGDI